jgi:hypothetical protein
MGYSRVTYFIYIEQKICSPNEGNNPDFADVNFMKLAAHQCCTNPMSVNRKVLFSREFVAQII